MKLLNYFLVVRVQPLSPNYDSYVNWAVSIDIYKILSELFPQYLEVDSEMDEDGKTTRNLIMDSFYRAGQFCMSRQKY